MPPSEISDSFGNLDIYRAVSAPTGLCYIASVLRQEGYCVSILDATAENIGLSKTVDRIVDFNPDIVGITCDSSKVFNGHEVVRDLKRKIPHLITVAGGAHITAVAERTLNEFPLFDMLVIGEGEITFKEIVEACNRGISLRRVKGIAFKENDELVFTEPRERIKNLDDLPFPAYDLLPTLQKYYWPYFNNVYGYPAFTISVTRGCPHHCNFCDNRVFGSHYTTHGPEFTVSLIETFVKKYGIKHLVFDDDNLLVNKKYILNVLGLMIEKRLKVSFSCAGRVDTIDEERVEKLKEAGCKLLMFGMESGSQRMLESMNKKITLDQIRHAVQLTRKYKINVLGFFILGFPGETEATMQETVDFIREIKPTDVTVQPFVPFPGSPIYEKALALGDYVEDWREVGTFSKVAYVAHGLTEQKIVEYLNKCNDACYKNLRTYATIYRRIHSLKHLRILINYLFHSQLWETKAVRSNAR